MARRTDMTGTTLSNTAAPPSAAMGVSLRAAPESSDGASSGHVAEPVDSSSNRSTDSRIPAILISTIFHTLLLILLALFSYRAPDGIGQLLTARQGEASSVLTLQAVDQSDFPIDDQDALVQQPVAVKIAPWVSSVAASPSPMIELSESERAALTLSGGQDGNESTLRQLPGGGLDGRSPEGRVKFGKLYGATAESERAVDEALAWLARHQRTNGSWSFDLDLDPCNGQCRHGRKQASESPTPNTAATGLALLAFLGAGHTHHRDGPYQETVRRGVYYLRSAAAEAEAGYDWQQGSMYGHGIALMALSEAHAMTSQGDGRNSELYELVRRGVSFTAVAQHRSGSWGYVPGSPGDMTVTGWQVLSLMGAKRKGIRPHSNTLRDAKSFVMSTCTNRDYWFGYTGPPGEPTTTAIGLTMLLYLGESPAYTPFYLALTDMANRGPTGNNIYHDYYATLALHHCRHHDWDRWNSKLRDHLVRTQATEGHERGSWHFDDKWGNIGGRLYTTAMCAMTLEVYYRYLPLYESIERFPL